MMRLEIGDRVKLLNEASEGVVKEITKEGKIMVETDDGFDFPYEVSELIKVNEDDMVEFDVNEEAISRKLSNNKSIDRKEQLNQGNSSFQEMLKKKIIIHKKEAVLEIDLHLEELISPSVRVHDWEKIEIQINHCKACIEEAMNLGISKLIFIHGVGEGVLKSEIRKLFDSYTNIRYNDANYQRYGVGATEVEIKGLFAG